MPEKAKQNRVILSMDSCYVVRVVFLHKKNVQVPQTCLKTRNKIHDSDYSPG